MLNGLKTDVFHTDIRKFDFYQWNDEKLLYERGNGEPLDLVVAVLEKSVKSAKSFIEGVFLCISRC
jgi:hypothetical protein